MEPCALKIAREIQSVSERRERPCRLTFTYLMDLADISLMDSADKNCRIVPFGWQTLDWAVQQVVALVATKK